MAFVVLAMALAAVWTAVRVVPCLPLVFPGTGGPVLLGNDPWFHLHQSEGAIEHFPGLLRWDVGTRYPSGERVAAAGLFDLATAAVALLLGAGEPSRHLTIGVLAWSPVVLGLVSLFLLGGLARELGGRRLAACALLVRVAFPGGELERTLLGFGDHHSAEIVLATGTLWLFARMARRIAAGEPRRKSLPAAAVAALPLSLFHFVWAGAPLHLAVLLGSFWGAALVGWIRGRGTPGPLLSYSGHFLAMLLLTGGAALLFPQLVMMPAALRLSGAAMLVQAVLVAGAGLAARGRAGGNRGARSLLLGVALGLVALAVLVAAAAPAGRFLEVFLERRNPFISEHLEMNLRMWWAEYGLILPWIALGLASVFRREGSFAARVVLLYVGGWAMLWQASSDFGYLAGALLPLAAAEGMVGMVRTLSRCGAPGGRRWAALPAGSFVLSLALALHGTALRRPSISTEEATELLIATSPWTEAMEWLRTETPRPAVRPTHFAAPWPSGRGFDYPPGSYGVLSHWQFGNLVCALGERLAVTSRTRSPVFIDWFLERDEDASHRRLEAMGAIPFVVLDAVSVCDSFVSEAVQAGIPVEEFQVVEDRVEVGGVRYPIVSFGRPFRESVGAGLYLGDAAAMERYRLVHESRELRFVRYRLIPELESAVLHSSRIGDGEELEELRPLAKAGASWTEEGGAYFCYSGQIVPAVKVFERVAGARLVGRAAAGKAVELELELRSGDSGRTFRYRRRGHADGEGEIEFLVPYPTDPAPRSATVAATGPYRVKLPGGRSVEVRVDEETVRRGGRVRFE